MLSYQHSYHAGNFADVVKHVTLSRLLNYIIQKDKPLFYLDTHAGRGLYHLNHAHALKTAEAQSGIGLLWPHKNQLPPVFSTYIDAIKHVNPNETLAFYPGSAQIAIHALRPTDRLFFNERHPLEFEQLAQLSKQNKRIVYQEQDGLIALKALLPPIERRGLIFIDPSFEMKTDYRDIPRALNNAYERFSTGMYCLWYPIIDNKLHQQLLRGLHQIPSTNHLRLEFNLTSRPQFGMTGCGLWIINPPYLLAGELQSAMQTLKKLFNPKESFFSISTD